MTDDSAKFKAIMGEWEAESAYLLQTRRDQDDETQGLFGTALVWCA